MQAGPKTGVLFAKLKYQNYGSWRPNNNAVNPIPPTPAKLYRSAIPEAFRMLHVGPTSLNHHVVEAGGKRHFEGDKGWGQVSLRSSLPNKKGREE